MPGLIPRPYLLLAVALAFVASNGVSFYRGYHTGRGFAEARQAAELAAAQAEAMKAAQAASRAETARLAAQAEADKLQMEAEDAARLDPNAGLCGLGADSVRRLAR